jgi:hypothetical protein
MTQSPVVEVMFRYEGLLAPLKLVEVVSYAGKEAFDFRADL